MSAKLPEPETFVSTKPASRGVTRGVTTGTLRKLASKLYTRNLIDPPQNFVRRNLGAIVAGFYAAVDSFAHLVALPGEQTRPFTMDCILQTGQAMLGHRFARRTASVVVTLA